MKESPEFSTPFIGELVTSRICHDLISPIGAISNGVELATLGGRALKGLEFDLVEQSAISASARIRFFRLCYGGGGSGAIGAGEIRAALTGFSPEGRVAVDWPLPGEMPRTQARIICLALQCLEAALAGPGEIDVGQDAGLCTLTAQGKFIRFQSGLWACLQQDLGDRDQIGPKQVQFLLLARLLTETGSKITVTDDTAHGRIALHIALSSARP